MKKDYSHIREATANDLDEIQTIYNEAILNTTAIYEYDPFDSAYIHEWWNQRITNNWPVIVAVCEEKVVGFATYGTFRARTAYRTTCEHSVYVLLIGGIDADNQLSIALHESEGFTIAGHLHEVAYKFDRWLDLVFMEKKL
jgi:L-amino acid N-acyltransferase YncA